MSPSWARRQGGGFTTPEDAARFVAATGVDALAVAVGSAHGFYKQPPKLDIERLKAIHAATDVVLVLHGSSGIPHPMVQEAIANGIAKVNLATEIKDTFMRALKQRLADSDEIDLRKVFPKAVAPVGRAARREIPHDRERHPLNKNLKPETSMKPAYCLLLTALLAAGCTPTPPRTDAAKGPEAARLPHRS